MPSRSSGVLVLVFALFACPRPLAAGADNAQLQCSSVAGPKSKQPVVAIAGDIPGDFAEFTLTVTQDGKSLVVSDQNGKRDQVHVVESWSSRVFTLVVAAKDPLHELKLYAVPSSVVVSKIPGGRKVKFNAIAELLPIPGFTGSINAASFHHDVQLKCTWQYEI